VRRKAPLAASSYNTATNAELELRDRPVTLAAKVPAHERPAHNSTATPVCFACADCTFGHELASHATAHKLSITRGSSVAVVLQTHRRVSHTHKNSSVLTLKLLANINFYTLHRTQVHSDERDLRQREALKKQ
jgi:hypothetical protein